MYAPLNFSKHCHHMPKADLELLDTCYYYAIKTQWRGEEYDNYFYGFIDDPVKRTSHHDRFITVTVHDENNKLSGFIYLHGWEYV